jgi:hypothetical protein
MIFNDRRDLNFVILQYKNQIITTMKKIFLVTVVALFSVSAVFAQNNGAIIKFDKTVHDYGEIFQNDNGQSVFTFTNTGSEPLILSNVRSSCGCTVPAWPKEPILPGQSAEIKVNYDTKRIGAINKQVTVLSNASENTVALSIKGNVKQKPAEVLPEKDVNTGFTPTAN